MVKATAPGKLMLSGEWSVLETGNPAVVLAVDKGVSAEVIKSEKMLFNFPDIGLENIEAEYDGQLHFSVEDKRLLIPKSAVEITLKYLEAIGVSLKPFFLSTESSISQVKLEDNSTAKIGFGSSAASTVATVAAVLSYHEVPPEKELVFKLSSLAHYLAQGKIGSGFDIAASTFGGVFSYTRFDPDWLMRSYEDMPVDQLVSETWPGFGVTSLAVPEGFVFSVGWTKKSAFTSEMVKEMRKFKTQNPALYERIISQIADITRELIKRIDEPEAYSLLEKNRELLLVLSEASGVEIETPELAKLAEIARENGGYGKLSGAGGGDCGIAVTFDKSKADRIKSDWTKAGIVPLDVSLAREGVRVS